MMLWIKRNRTTTGKPFGVTWHTPLTSQVRYFDDLPTARAFALKKMGYRGMVIEEPGLEAEPYDHDSEFREEMEREGREYEREEEAFQRGE